MLDERDPLDELAEVRATMEAVRERLARTGDGELGRMAARLERLTGELERIERVVGRGTELQLQTFETRR